MKRAFQVAGGILVAALLVTLVAVFFVGKNFFALFWLGAILVTSAQWFWEWLFCLQGRFTLLPYIVGGVCLAITALGLGLGLHWWGWVALVVFLLFLGRKRGGSREAFYEAVLHIIAFILLSLLLFRPS